MDRLREMLRRLKEELDSNSGSDGGSSSNSSSSSSSSSVSLSSSSSCVRDSDSDRDEVPPSRATCSFEDLKKQMETMLEEPERPLRPGDVVVWKDGCQNRKRPKLGEFAVVARVLDHPVFGDEFVLVFYFSLIVFIIILLPCTTDLLQEARTSESRLTLC